MIKPIFITLLNMIRFGLLMALTFVSAPSALFVVACIFSFVVLVIDWLAPEPEAPVDLWANIDIMAVDLNEPSEVRTSLVRVAEKSVARSAGEPSPSAATQDPMAKPAPELASPPASTASVAPMPSPSAPEPSATSGSGKETPAPAMAAGVHIEMTTLTPSPSQVAPEPSAPPAQAQAPAS